MASTIGPWRLGSALGHGSTGSVQLAHNTKTGQQAAIKVISKAMFRGLAASDRNAGTNKDNDPPSGQLPYGIEREIIIMKLLRHPSVLSLYDVWETKNSLYMVLEYAEKGELFNLLVERGPLPEREAVRFFRQIIIGISYCHALGIAHRDLKPENILLDHHQNIKIADFGMAALETEEQLLETSCGSPHYAAPEIVSGIPYHGFASDVWSCGVILFALLTGRLPFDEDDGNIRNLLLKVQRGRFEMPDSDEVSPEAQDLLRKILTVDPAKRIKTRDILKHPLLAKYPNIKDSQSISKLPREDTYLRPLTDSNSEIDQAILENLVILWNNKDPGEITHKLKEPGQNMEKTLYALLYRFKKETDKLKSDASKRASIRLDNPRKRQSILGSSPKKKNRMSTISVTSSHRKPLSFQKVATMNNSSNTNINDITHTPKSKRLSNTFNYTNSTGSKRSSLMFLQNDSPTPASKNKRLSIITLDKSTPPVPKNIIKRYNSKLVNKRASRSGKRLSFAPNGSLSTKLLSNYAKLVEDDNWEYIERETRKTSSDFATLIDEIFEYEKFEQVRKEKAELERKVRDEKERQLREAEKQRLDAERREKEEQLKLAEEMAKLKLELAERHQSSNKALDDPPSEEKVRSVSEPLESKTKSIELDLDDENLTALIHGKSKEDRRAFSAQSRPVSRLDPGLANISYSPLETKKIPATYNTSIDEQRLKTEKKILETIRRSRFLGSSFDINQELQRSNRPSSAPLSTLKYVEPGFDTTGISSPADSKPTVLQALHQKKRDMANSQLDPSIAYGTTKLSEIKVPQLTRKSRHFGEYNKRLSVLSLYSSKQSYTNLVDILKEGGVNLPSSSEDTTASDQFTRPVTDREFSFETADSPEIPSKSRLLEEYENRKVLYEVPEESDPNLNSGLRYNFDDSPVKKYDENISEIDFSPEDINHLKSSHKQDEEEPEIDLPVLPAEAESGEKNNGLGLYKNSKPNNELSMTPSANIAAHDNLKSTDNARQTEEGSLNDAIPKRVKKTESTQQAKKPLKDLSVNTEPEKENRKRNVSFFRKFSGTSNSSKTPYEPELRVKVSQRQLYNGLSKLLKNWTQYGLKDVKVFSSSMSITGKLSNDNILSLRSTVFELVVESRNEGATVKIRKKSGSSKTLKRLVDEIEKVLEKEGVLLETVA